MSEARNNLELQVGLLEAEIAGSQVRLEKMKAILNELIPCPTCRGTGLRETAPGVEVGCEDCKSIFTPSPYGGGHILNRGMVFKLQ